MIMKEFSHTVGKRRFDLYYAPTTKQGDYDAVNFDIYENNQHKFYYVIKISGTFEAMLLNQKKVDVENFEEILTNVFIEFAKNQLNNSNFSNFEFMFTSDKQALFDGLFALVKIPPEENPANKDKRKILTYLYNSHYQLFNKDDIPVSLRILTMDLNIEKQRLIDYLKEMELDREIEMIKLGQDNIFARILTGGIKKIENR